MSDKSATAQALQRRNVNQWYMSKYSTITKTLRLVNDQSASVQALQKRKVSKC